MLKKYQQKITENKLTILKVILRVKLIFIINYWKLKIIKITKYNYFHNLFYNKLRTIYMLLKITYN